MPASQRLAASEPDSASRMSTAEQLYSELQAADATLLESMSVMDRITRQPTCDKSQYTDARFKISHASFTRRTLVRRIYGHLLPRVSDTDAQSLRKLEIEQYDLLRHSSEHMARWSVLDIEKDWEGYCAASREIRAHMHRSYETERDGLYAILLRNRQL